MDTTIEKSSNPRRDLEGIINTLGIIAKLRTKDGVKEGVPIYPIKGQQVRISQTDYDNILEWYPMTRKQRRLVLGKRKT